MAAGSLADVFEPVLQTGGRGIEAGTVVMNGHHQCMTIEEETYPCLCRFRMPGHVVDRLFENEIDVASLLHIQLEDFPLRFNHCFQVDSPGFEETGGIVQHSGKSLTKCIDIGIDAPDDLPHGLR